MLKLNLVVYVLLGLTSDALGRDWWEHAQLYQIYPRSFMDTNGDGIGDLKGVIQKLDHLKDAGAEGVWLSPIFASPMVDFGYDISDYRTIHPEFGTMEDFANLVAKCKSLGIKLILDFVPNHTSDEHEWFVNSVNRVEGYEDYYLWDDGKADPQNSSNKIPPSNWNSIFYGSGWKWNDARQQFYFHAFHVRQPDLNYRNPKVVQEMKDILTFWMEKGADGFRVDAINYLFEADKAAHNGTYPDEPLSGETNDTKDYAYLRHDYTKDLPETYDMVTQWRDTLEEYKTQHGGDTRVMMVEAYTTTEKVMRYYGNDSHPGAHFPFNFNFITTLNKHSTASEMVHAVNDFMVNMPNDVGANWVIGNHDNSRVTSRYGEERVDGITMIIMLLPGVGVTYQGDEIAMKDGYLTWEETVDPQACNSGKDVYQQKSRDPERSPFQWDSSKNAGFSTADKTWLPVNEDYLTINLAAQKLATKSHYKTFQAISKLRLETTFADGKLVAKALDPNVFAFKRYLRGYPTYVVVVNSSAQRKSVSLISLGSDLPPLLSIALTSTKAIHQAGNLVEARNLILGPYEALVLKTI